MLTKLYKTSKKILFLLLAVSFIIIFLKVTAFRLEINVFYTGQQPILNDFVITLLGGKINYYEISRVNMGMALISNEAYNAMKDNFMTGVIVIGADYFSVSNENRIYNYLFGINSISAVFGGGI